MREEQAARIIQSLTGQLTGSDITGDISSWRYATWWKRLLSAGDGQSTRMSPAQIAAAQAGQHRLTTRLLQHMAAACSQAGWLTKSE